MCETYSERRTWMLEWILANQYFTKAELLNALEGVFKDSRIGLYETVPDYLDELTVDGLLAYGGGYYRCASASRHRGAAQEAAR